MRKEDRISPIGRHHQEGFGSILHRIRRPRRLIMGLDGTTRVIPLGQAPETYGIDPNLLPKGVRDRLFLEGSE